MYAPTTHQLSSVRASVPRARRPKPPPCTLDFLHRCSAGQVVLGEDEETSRTWKTHGGIGMPRSIPLSRICIPGMPEMMLLRRIETG